MRLPVIYKLCCLFLTVSLICTIKLPQDYMCKLSHQQTAISNRPHSRDHVKITHNLIQPNCDAVKVKLNPVQMKSSTQSPVYSLLSNQPEVKFAAVDCSKGRAETSPATIPI